MHTRDETQRTHNTHIHVIMRSMKLKHYPQRIQKQFEKKIEQEKIYFVFFHSNGDTFISRVEFWIFWSIFPMDLSPKKNVFILTSTRLNGPIKYCIFYR